MKIGATGEFHDRFIDPDDAGGFVAGLALDPPSGTLRLEFGQPITWLAMTAEQAREFAARLIQKADELDQRKI